MAWLAGFVSLLRNLFRGGRVERELRNEVDSYLDLLTDEKIAAGMTPKEARRAARVEFGAVEHVKERVRDVRVGTALEQCWQDVRHGARLLRRAPGVSVVAVVTLALGIGASTAIFSVINGVLLKPLPYPDQDRLVNVGHLTSSAGSPREVFLSSGSYLVYRDESRTLANLAIYFPTGVNVSGIEPALRVEGAAVDRTLLPTLGVSPALGRGFGEADVAPGATRVALISHGFWQRAFGGGAGILGTTVRLDGRETEIVGVMPPAFAFPDRTVDIWYPASIDAANARNVNFSFRGVGRLAPGVSVAQAEAELDRLFERPFELYRNEGISAEQLRGMGFRVDVQPLIETVVGDVGDVLWVIMAAVGLILLVACANVANLFLVQADSREREVALQAALGASRGRLVRQLLAQSALVGILGGLVGLGLAVGGVRLLTAVGTEELPRLTEIAIEGRVLGFTAVVSLLSALFFGSFPALRFRTGRTAALLQESSGRTAGWRSARQRVRSGLVVAQLALALVLLAASGLMVRTFANLRAVDPGFRTENLLVFDLTLSGPTASGAEDAIAFHQRVLDAVAAIPGVESASAASRYFGLPVANPANPNPVWVEDRLPPEDSLPASRPLRIVMPGYFETLGIPLLSGRPIERRDIEQQSGAAVVSGSFAEATWGDEDPLGKRISPLPGTAWLTVVGVAGEVRQSNLYEAPAPSIYFGALLPGGATYSDTDPMTYAVRTATNPMSAVPPVREAVREIAPELPVANVRTMSQVVGSSMARTSFTLLLLGVGAVIGLLLAAVGIYGVMAHVVTQRRQEIGVRMALGAETASILRLVLAQAGAVIAAGVGLGMLGAVGLTRLLESLLFDVAPVDAVTYAGVSLLLATAAMVASYLPARQASRVDPMRALQHE